MTLLTFAVPAGNLGPLPLPPTAPTSPRLDPNSPEGIAKALLQHVESSGLPYPPASDPDTDMAMTKKEVVPEPDMRQCYQIVDGQLVSVPLQLVLPKPKPKGAMKRQGGQVADAGGTAGIEASRPSFLARCASKLRLKPLDSLGLRKTTSGLAELQLT